ncbi:MAG: AGE family epimerase/isomerase [Lachnospiraceae bacterium]|nr:AGE family epimerase/isomerase [Lachnospiraceae bacterium]
MYEFVREINDHLWKRLIPFWKGLKDDRYGGFYGYMGYDRKVCPTYEKGCILNSRILWFFSNVSLLIQGKGTLPVVEQSGNAAANSGKRGKIAHAVPASADLAASADDINNAATHAYHFLRDVCLDRECGGVYWSVTYDGRPKDATKHTYNQAFAIYALASYYDATGEEEALQLAFDLQRVIEEKCTDEYGYMEAFDREFRPVSNEKLSENGVMAEKTMNTLLHVFEAYTELYRVTETVYVDFISAEPLRNDRECGARPDNCSAAAHADSVHAFTGDRLRAMLDRIAETIYNPVLCRQEVFFDRKWNSLIDLHSYGHDIETAWLVDRGLDLLRDREYTERLRPITAALSRKVCESAYRGHSLLNEAENGKQDTTRVWWVQAEAVVGFVNAWQRQPGALHYLSAAMDIWNYIKTTMVDPREGSEWFWSVDETGIPSQKPIVEPWKCPYHNGRMCLEILKRLS